MASIRLFGRGRNAAAAVGGPAVSAELIADALEGLTAASMSTTWRCRHGAGASLGEGAVDFAARRSRSTVIRGKYAFEYVRSGSSVFRARVQDMDGDGGDAQVVAAGAGASGSADVLDAAIGDEDEDGTGVEGDELDEGDEGDEGELEGLAEDDDEIDGEDEDEGALDAEDDSDDPDAEAGSEGAEDEDSGDDVEAAADADGGEPEAAGDVSGSAGVEWETFSEHDACGVHAYAEPAVLAAGVRAAGVVQAREAQEFDGVLLSAFSVTVKPKPGDPNRLLARLARQLRDHGANVVVITAFADESQPSAADDGPDADADGAGNGDGSGSLGGSGGGPRIVRLRIELPHWTPADDPTADHTVSVDLFEFGEPVSVAVPGGAVRRKARSCADLALF